MIQHGYAATRPGQQAWAPTFQVGFSKETSGQAEREEQATHGGRKPAPENTDFQLSVVGKFDFTASDSCRILLDIFKIWIQ